MSASPPSSGGWLESLHRIGESLLVLMRNRFELFTVELQEERLRMINLLIWLSVALAVGVAGVWLTIVLLAFWLWNVAGYAGVVGLVLTTLAISAGIIWNIRQRIHSGPTPFEQTMAEFRKDGECLRKND